MNCLAVPLTNSWTEMCFHDAILPFNKKILRGKTDRKDQTKKLLQLVPFPLSGTVLEMPW